MVLCWSLLFRIRPWIKVNLLQTPFDWDSYFLFQDFIEGNNVQKGFPKEINSRLLLSLESKTVQSGFTLERSFCFSTYKGRAAVPSHLSGFSANSMGQEKYLTVVSIYISNSLQSWCLSMQCTIYSLSLQNTDQTQNESERGPSQFYTAVHIVSCVIFISRNSKKQETTDSLHIKLCVLAYDQYISISYKKWTDLLNSS